jgi:proteasome lid subunit RPN8/RPN11
VQAHPDDTLLLLSEVREACRVHAAAAFPREACGVVVWRGSTATAYVPAANSATSNLAFVVDLEHAVWDELLDAEEQDASIVLGLYHSHAHGRAVPSEADLQGLDASWHGRPYVVYSVPHRAWWLGRILPQ